jgi:MinD superfamily P-loop ATPase
MILSIASGKGGTGKTTVAVNLALSLGKVHFIDCDVEEPNAHLFLRPRMRERLAASVLIPEVDEDRCTHCGMCGEICAFNAIAVVQGKNRGGTVLIFPHLCHSCGACALLCPEHAIREVPKPIGVIEEGHAGDIRFVHGRLEVGEIMSPPLIRQVKERAFSSPVVRTPSEHATRNRELFIIDAPPGNACPAVAAVQGSDFCLLVTEPTPFGLHDLKLAVDVMRGLAIPFGVVINRDGSGDELVGEYCAAEEIPVLMRIPLRRDIAVRYASGLSIVDVDPALREEFLTLYRSLVSLPV